MKDFINKNNRITILTGGLLVIALVMFIKVLVSLQPTDEVANEEISWGDLVGENSQEEMSSEAESETEAVASANAEAYDYPAPDYDFKTQEVTIEIGNLDREYRFAWVSDVHLMTDTEAGDVQVEYLDYIAERRDTLPVDENGIHSDEFWQDIIKFLNYEDFDGVIFGGDIMDYCSSSNIETVKEGLDSLRMQYMYIRSDHDYGNWYGNYKYTESVTRRMQMQIDGDDSSQKIWDMGDFIVMGIDNSYMNMSDDYLSMIEDVYSMGKPVIMATHVPYESKVDDSLAELSMSERNTLYYWGGKYQPNEITSKYFDLVYAQDSVVKGVLAGHMHAGWDGMITDQIPEHIFAPAYTGNIGVITVK